jgi:hypothetical protein
VQKISFNESGRPKLKLYDAQKALRLILKAHGAFNHDQRHELTGEDGEPIQVIFDDNVPESDDPAND